MMALKRLFIVIGLFILACIIIMGICSVLDIYLTKAKIKKNGVETICIIKNKWRGKCGSGSGNSVTFKIRGLNDEFIHRCGVPDEVQIGDMYMVKYLIDDPTKHIIFFDKKITTIPEK